MIEEDPCPSLPWRKSDEIHASSTQRDTRLSATIDYHTCGLGRLLQSGSDIDTDSRMQGTRASLEIAQAASIRSTKGNWCIIVPPGSTA